MLRLNHVKEALVAWTDLECRLVISAEAELGRNSFLK